ncbi:MAG: surface protein [Gemmatales bacterium]|nr:MAG: surface protein [Gemmatales bacterium]
MTRSSLAATLIVLVIPIGLQANPPLQSLTVFPQQIVLDGPRAEQHVVVIGEFADGSRRDLTREAKLQVGDMNIAVVEGGVVRPARDGETLLTIAHDGKTAKVPVRVEKAQANLPVDFNREVIPVLTKAKCNQGACHGGQHGKGGFKLSLRGFDPPHDYEQIVQSAEGRRIVPSDPERSILLLKPTLIMEHGGGELIKAGGSEYQILKRWLEDGTPPPARNAPAVTSLSVFPTSRVMKSEEQQQIAVTATWSDGLTRDVTSLAQFDSLNEAVATVTPNGLVTAKSKGVTHIMVRFEGQVGVVQIMLPYRQIDPYPDLPRYNFIDDKLIAKWKELGLTPSPLCSDVEFFRRIHLDTIGTLPKPEEIKAFLADTSADKRAKAIEQVLQRPEFVDFWTLKWGDLLRINRAALNDKGMWSFHNWVRASLRDGKKLDQFVREIITAEGSTFRDGPANYYGVGRNPSDWAEATAQVFLGVRIQCAKCHHHPFEKWSQDDYYGMTAFFIRLANKGSQEFGIFGRETVLYLRQTGEQRHPRKGTIVPPHPLDGPPMDDPFDRRVKLADWITSKENPFFAKNIVNRFWGYFMGRGLVEPLDDMRATNPPSNPDLLDALAKDFVDNGFDLKHLMRTIMNSRAYQLSSRIEEGNRADATNTHFTRYTVKRLTAEQLADAIDFATGTREKYQGLPLGTRAIQLPDPAVASYLLDIFGRAERKITCECERTMQPNIAQALHLLNGDFLNRKIADGNGRIARLMKNKTPLPKIVEELYLVTLSRPPQPAESKKAQELVAKAPSLREGLQDLLWALLNSREFLFNH